MLNFNPNHIRSCGKSSCTGWSHRSRRGNNSDDRSANKTQFGWHCSI